MSDTRSSTGDEKAAVFEDSKPKGGFFTRRKAAKAVSDEKNVNPSTEVQPIEAQVTPVSFSALFR
jgi:hypothetical protein